MNTELQQFIERSDYYQGALRELALLLPVDDAELDALIAETVAGSDQLSFVFIVMAALALHRPVQGRHLTHGAILIPDKLTLGVMATHMTGDIARPLVEAVTTLVLPKTELVSSALFLAANWQHEHEGGKLSGKLIGAARTAARDKTNATYDVALMHAVAVLSGDEGLKKLVLERCELSPGDPRADGMEKGAVNLGEEMLKIWRSDPLGIVPVTPHKNLAEGGTMRRSVARTSRNAPCPCGSGKKYKHCCVDKDEERLRHSTNIAGVTQAELRANPERYLTTIDLESYPSHEVARMDPLKLPPERREAYLANLCRAQLFDECVAGLEKFGYADALKEAFDNVLLRVAQARRKDLVERLLKVRPVAKGERMDGAVELLLADTDPSALVKTLQQGPLELLGEKYFEQYRGFAYTLLRSNLCALGVFVARGMMPLLPLADATALYEELLKVRDKLCLPPDDPIIDVLDQRAVEQHDEGKDAEALREAQSRLEAKMAEVQRYRDSVKRLEHELHRREQLAAEKKPVTPAMPAVPGDEVALSEMRQKVNALKSALKQRHEERNDLRRELQKAYTNLEQLRETTAPVADRTQAESDQREDDLLLPEEMSGQQPVRTIECPPDFQQTLRRVPPSVARGTMAVLGRLAAGEPAAFMGAIRLKACPDILRRRVGIDFRLLFRLLPDRVQVVDLIPRQDLERKIKTLI